MQFSRLDMSGSSTKTLFDEASAAAVVAMNTSIEDVDVVAMDDANDAVIGGLTQQDGTPTTTLGKCYILYVFFFEEGFVHKIDKFFKFANSCGMYNYNSKFVVKWRARTHKQQLHTIVEDVFYFIRIYCTNDLVMVLLLLLLLLLLFLIIIIYIYYINLCINVFFTDRNIDNNNNNANNITDDIKYQELVHKLSNQIINYMTPLAICHYGDTSCRSMTQNNMNNTTRAQADDDDISNLVPPVITAAAMNRDNLAAVEYISRYNMGNEKFKQCLAHLRVLDQWSKYPVIAIDGQNGTTKSTLAGKLCNRTLLKINDLMPDITSGSDYNHHALKSLEYMCGQVCYQPHTNQALANKFIVWDRCCFSNLIFYFIHQLMAHYENSSIPRDYRPVWQLLNTIATDMNLMSTINVILQYQRQIQLVALRTSGGRHQQPPPCVGIPTIFFVCRNLDFIALVLRQRGINSSSYNDIYNAVQYNYQVAQYYVYSWFAQLLNYPIIDIADFLDAGCSISTIHMLLTQKLNPRSTLLDIIQPTATSIYASNPRSINNSVTYDNDNDARAILNYCTSPNTLIYDFSKK